MNRLLERLALRRFARVGFLSCVFVLLATPAFAQSIPFPPPPFQPPSVGYVPLSVPACTQVQQVVNLDLSTTPASGIDPHWIVTGPSGYPNYGGPSPYHTSFGAWTTLSNYWVQPKQSSSADFDAKYGYYTYTIWFNLPCPTASYQNLHISGSFGADNDGAVFLNGATTALASCTNNYCFNTAATAFAASSGFVQGLNMLSVVVLNTGVYTGLAVKAAVSGTCREVCGQPDSGLIKICKVAGPGVPVGMLFSFTANSGPLFTVPAGPGPGGTCVIGPSFPVGTIVNVVENNIPSGYAVSNITVAPPGQLASGPDLVNGSVGVTIGSGVTEVTYTDYKNTGYLEICKKGGHHVIGNFTFTVNPGNIGPITVPAGACSSAIEVPAGPVVITETSGAGTMTTACSTIPASQQVSCAPPISTVTVAPGDISTETIAIITNQPGPLPDHPK